MGKSSVGSLTSDIIVKTLEEHEGELQAFGVKRIGLFGSFLNKTQRKKSDVDLLVDFDRPTFDRYMELKFLLEKLFRRKVDLVVEDSLKPALRYVKKEAVYV